ncbi:hypothetical protein M0Q97_08090 [Candidatus Dojkabacteria bacterium]|jgi:hypothetical protein|nr:hypothetical protein [Candidatus Dojkabacteria bacterium]
MEKSIQSKEQLIISTLFSCNREIKNFHNETKLFENFIDKQPIYHYNMLTVYSNITDVPFQNLNENELFNESYIKMNDRKNYYVYFQKVNEFLSGFSLDIQKSLNESLIVDKKKVENLNILNIDTFKNDLKQLLSKLESIDNFSLPKNVIKIKSSLNLPLYVYGFNIVNNFQLLFELQTKFNILQNELISIIYDKSNKSILFCTKTRIILYDIQKDEFIETKFKLDLKSSKGYLQILKEETEIFDMYEIYTNPIILNIKFTDNLYNDGKYADYIKYIDSQKIIR